MFRLRKKSLVWQNVIQNRKQHQEKQSSLKFSRQGYRIKPKVITLKRLEFFFQVMLR